MEKVTICFFDRGGWYSVRERGEGKGSAEVPVTRELKSGNRDALRRLAGSASWPVNTMFSLCRFDLR